MASVIKAALDVGRARAVSGRPSAPASSYESLPMLLLLLMLKLIDDEKDDAPPPLTVKLLPPPRPPRIAPPRIPPLPNSLSKSANGSSAPNASLKQRLTLNIVSVSAQLEPSQL